MNYDDIAHMGCVTSRHMRSEEIKNREKNGVEQKGPGLKVLWEHSEAGQELGRRAEGEDKGPEPGIEKGSQSVWEGRDRLQVGTEQMSLQLLWHFSSYCLALKLGSRLLIYINTDRQLHFCCHHFLPTSHFVTYR